MSAGPLDPFNHAVSFVVTVTIRPNSTATGTRFSRRLGRAVRLAERSLRSLVADRPAVLGELMAAPDRARAKRASDAMMKMVKIDIAALQAAFAERAEPDPPIDRGVQVARHRTSARCPVSWVGLGKSRNILRNHGKRRNCAARGK